MGLTQLDIIRKQIESAAKNRAAGEAAKLRRKTSLIGEISRLTGKANRTIDQAGREGTAHLCGRLCAPLAGAAAVYAAGLPAQAAAPGRGNCSSRAAGAGCAVAAGPLFRSKHLRHIPRKRSIYLGRNTFC